MRKQYAVFFSYTHTFRNRFDTMIKNRKTLQWTAIAKIWSASRGERAIGRSVAKKKGREGICQGIETAQSYPQEFQSRFWSRERPRNALGPMFETMLRLPHRPLPLSNSLPSSPLSHSFSLRLSSGLVREPSHSQKTQNADGHVSRRYRSAAGKGPKNEGEEGKNVCVCVCVLWRQAVHRLIFFVALCRGIDAEVSLFRHRRIYLIECHRV